MNLNLEIIKINDVQFGSATAVKNNVLYVNKQELIDYIADPQLVKIDIDIARPGESVRIIPCKDVIEPRIKTTENGGSFPGIFGEFDGCGEGNTKVLRGCSVVTTGSIIGFQEGIIDMFGPVADYTPYSKLNNVVIVAEPVEGIHPTKHEKVIRLAGLKAAYYLAKAAKEVPADEVENYELKPVENLPKVAYIYAVLAQGLLHDNYLYGVDAKKLHTTLIHPNELFDGALVSGNCVVACEKYTTYDHQNNPLIQELYSRHGVDLDFAGVIISPISPVLADKERCCSSAINIARQIGAQAIIAPEEGGGNPEADLMMLVKKAEKNGIKAVIMVSPDGVDEPLADCTPEADAVIDLGGYEQIVVAPKMDKVIGHEESARLLAGSPDDVKNPDGSLNVSMAVIMSSLNNSGRERLSSVVV